MRVLRLRTILPEVLLTLVAGVLLVLVLVEYGWQRAPRVTPLLRADVGDGTTGGTASEMQDRCPLPKYAQNVECTASTTGEGKLTCDCKCTGDQNQETRCCIAEQLKIRNGKHPDYLPGEEDSWIQEVLYAQQNNDTKRLEEMCGPIVTCAECMAPVEALFFMINNPPPPSSSSESSSSSSSESSSSESSEQITPPYPPTKTPDSSSSSSRYVNIVIGLPIIAGFCCANGVNQCGVAVAQMYCSYIPDFGKGDTTPSVPGFWSMTQTMCLASCGCGNGILDPGEECDDGAKNITPDLANKLIADLEDQEVTQLLESSCVSCKIGACQQFREAHKKDQNDDAKQSLYNCYDYRTCNDFWDTQACAIYRDNQCAKQGEEVPEKGWLPKINPNTTCKFYGARETDKPLPSDLFEGAPKTEEHPVDKVEGAEYSPDASTEGNATNPVTVDPKEASVPSPNPSNFFGDLTFRSPSQKLVAEEPPKLPPTPGVNPPGLPPFKSLPKPGQGPGAKLGDLCLPPAPGGCHLWSLDIAEEEIEAWNFNEVHKAEKCGDADVGGDQACIYKSVYGSKDHANGTNYYATQEIATRMAKKLGCETSAECPNKACVVEFIDKKGARLCRIEDIGSEKCPVQGTCGTSNTVCTSSADCEAVYCMVLAGEKPLRVPVETLHKNVKPRCSVTTKCVKGEECQEGLECVERSTIRRNGFARCEDPTWNPGRNRNRNNFPPPFPGNQTGGGGYGGNPGTGGGSGDNTTPSTPPSTKPKPGTTKSSSSSKKSSSSSKPASSKGTSSAKSSSSAPRSSSRSEVGSSRSSLSSSSRSSFSSRSSSSSSFSSTGYCCMTGGCKQLPTCSMTESLCKATCNSSSSVSSGYCCFNNRCTYQAGCGQTYSQCTAYCLSSSSRSSSLGHCCINNLCSKQSGCTQNLTYCAATCQYWSARSSTVSTCGNGRIDAGEECDGNAMPAGLICLPTCRISRIDAPSSFAYSSGKSYGYPSSPPPIPSSRIGTPCTTDDQCGVILKCIDGFCQVPMPCSFDFDCGPDEKCILGLCVPPMLQCKEDDECPNGLRCIEGLCMESQTCTKTSECRKGEECIAGVCEVPVKCTSNTECAPRVCLCNRCTPAPSTCLSSPDCLEVQTCTQGECLWEEELACLAPFCGNGRLDKGEQCDKGMENADAPNAPCRTDCSIPRCGDGIVDPPLETCDDGNKASGDGCSKTCKIEPRAITPSDLPAQVIDLHPPKTSTGGVPPEVTQTPTPPSTPDGGPAALAIIALGASAGFAMMRQRKRRMSE